MLERAKNILQDNKRFDSLDFESVKRTRFSPQIHEFEGTEYNNNHFWTANGLLIYGWILFNLGIVLLTPVHDFFRTWLGIAVLALLILSLPIALSYQMHYFTITDRFLIVRNTFWFWRKHVYPLEEIREIVREKPYNWPFSLRVITDDFRDKLYPASSLSKHTWNELIARIEQDGIKVRKEV